MMVTLHLPTPIVAGASAAAVSVERTAAAATSAVVEAEMASHTALRRRMKHANQRLIISVDAAAVEADKIIKTINADLKIKTVQPKMAIRSDLMASRGGRISASSLSKRSVRR